MESIKTQLMDMGFNESKVKRAIESCPEAQTLEQVMEWLIAHEDELNSSGPSNSSVTTKAAPPAAKAEPKPAAENKANSANQSGNITQRAEAGGTEESATTMAARKKITVEEAQRLISERQAKRIEEERKQAIEDEKTRRLAGQKMAQTRAELQDQERIRLAQQIRREKLEKEVHRKKVLDQIASDREAMRNRNKQVEVAASNSSSNGAGTGGSVIKSQPKAPSTECRLALRFPDGSSLTQTFSPQEQLAAVRLFVQLKKDAAKTAQVEFVAPPNKKLTESMMSESLESLGLCPASRLEVKYNQVVIRDLD